MKLLSDLTDNEISIEYGEGNNRLDILLPQTQDSLGGVEGKDKEECGVKRRETAEACISHLSFWIAVIHTATFWLTEEYC